MADLRLKRQMRDQLWLFISKRVNVRPEKTWDSRGQSSSEPEVERSGPHETCWKDHEIIFLDDNMCVDDIDWYYRLKPGVLMKTVGLRCRAECSCLDLSTVKHRDRCCVVLRERWNIETDSCGTTMKMTAPAA